MADGRSRRSGYVAAVFLGVASVALVQCGPSRPATTTLTPVSGPTVSASSSAATTRSTSAALAPLGAPATPGATRSPAPTGSVGPTGSTGVVGSKAPSTKGKPNFVLILADDASMNLLQYMPRVQQMQRSGTTFSNYFVTDSLCCPSRTSIFTGRYPHNTGIYSNHAPDGGYKLFHQLNGEADTFATDLQSNGYRTALMGKYLNEYMPGKAKRPGPIPPGWTEWAVGGNAYSNFNYKLNENGKVKSYGKSPKDYMTDVLAKRGATFIERAVAMKKPFMLEIAPYAPHSPYTPAPRDSKKFPGLKAPRTASYNAANLNAPSWLASKKPLSEGAIKTLDRKYRLRAQSVLAIDAMITRIQAELVEQGVADNTYLIFSSDNGFHLGEHRLKAGKQTAFDTDIHVPLVVTGPGVPAGHTVGELAENIDLRPTFAALSGAAASPIVDGRDLSNLLHGGAAVDPRDAVLVEHHGAAMDPNDPDAQPTSSGNPPTYAALRGPDWLYVEYITGEREYYDTVSDPEQLNNVVGAVPPYRLAQLHKTLAQMQACSGAVACWNAQRM
jgi:N-acetylglucosamine-6-sulfatase